MCRLLWCVLILAIASTSGAAQDASLRDTRYQDLLARLFETPPRGNLDRPVVTLRFSPSSKPEAQCIIEFTEKGAAASCTTLMEPLVKTLDSSLEQSLEETFKRIPSRREKRTVDRKDSERWLKEMWHAVSKSPQEINQRLGRIQLDGTSYEICIETGLSTMTFTVQDQEALGDRLTGSMAIVRWANQVRLEVLR